MGKKLKKIKVSKFWNNIFKNRPLMILVAVFILAAIFSNKSVQNYLRIPSQAAGIGIVPPGITDNSTNIFTPNIKFGPIIQLTGQLGFPPDGSYNFPVNDEWTQSIYGDWLVFKWDPSVGNPEDQEYMLYNLKTKEIRQLTNNGTFSIDMPRIWGQHVTWVGDDRNLYLYNIGTGVKSQLTTDHKVLINSEFSVDINNDRIVFVREEIPWEEYTLNIIDLSQGKAPVKLFTKDFVITNPVIDGSIIAWRDARHAIEPTDCEIYAYNMDSGVEFPISTGVHNRTNLSASGGYIIGIDIFDNPYSSTLFKYNLASQQGGKVELTNASWIAQPYISNGYIVYIGAMDANFTNPKLYMYEISTGKETKIIDSDIVAPVIFKGKYLVIAWEQYSGSSRNLYMVKGSYFSQGLF